MKTVYLAGPISGQNYQDATEWRKKAHHALIREEILTYSPMRAKSHLSNEGDLTHEGLGTHPLSTSKFIMDRDYQDATLCDLILINFDVPHPGYSIGTIMEIAWAYQMHKPVIVVDSPVFNYKKHPMLQHAVTLWAKDLAQAIEFTKIILHDDQWFEV